MGRKKREKQASPAEMLNNQVDKDLEGFDKAQEIAKTNQVLSAKEQRRAERLARKALKKIKRNAVGGSKDDGKDDEGNPKRNREKASRQLVAETYIKVDGETVTVSTDFHDGSSPKIKELKKGDFLRLRVVIEV